MSSETRIILDEIEQLVRGGNSNQAQLRLKKLKTAKLSSDLRARYAALARRAQIPQVALRLLRPIVRNSPNRDLGGTPLEQIEYAATLIIVGAIDEGSDILNSIEDMPAVGLLYQAYAHVARWDYQVSIPFLEKYVSLPEVDSYQRLVANINLAAALVHERIPKAPYLVNELLQETDRPELMRLHGHVVQLKAQWLISLKQYDWARQLLEDAQRAHANVGGLDGFFIRKWMAIIHVLEKRGCPESLASLEQVKSEARQLEHWETVRDCDVYKALALKDEKLLLHLIIGSPFTLFRRHLLSQFGAYIEIPSVYLWNPTGVETPTTIDLLRDGRAPSGKTLKLGQAIHKVLYTLTSDFYRPCQVASLYAALCPGQFYNAASSPSRIYEIIKRTRKWLKDNQVPLRVEEISGTYCLGFEPETALWIPTSPLPATGPEFLLESLRSHFGSRPFSIAEASKQLGRNPWNILKVLQVAHQQGLCRRQGKGRSTTYQFLDDEGQLKQGT